MTWFRQHFFSVTLVTLLVLVALASYLRFIVLNDYVVAYEGDCDPYTESCFIGCEDDECTKEYYYVTIQKYAPNVEAQCGTDITDCDAAYECLPEDGDQCEITYCDPAVDGGEACETLTEADMEEEEEPDEGAEDVSLDEESEEVVDEGMEEIDAESVMDEGEVE
jgi:hypothetical protein